MDSTAHPLDDPTAHVAGFHSAASSFVSRVDADNGLAVADHGAVRGHTVHGTSEESAQVFADLTAVGIDLDDVFATVGTEGVEKFVVSWQELLGTVRSAPEGAGADA